MKKTFDFIVCSLALCGFAFAKSPLAELKKAREIKLLQSTREDVKRILAGYEHDADEDEDNEQTFSTENAEIEVSFAKGDCADDSEYWNVDEWVVTKIEIDPENELKVEDIAFNFSGFTKEVDEEYPEDYIYQDENSGIVFIIDDKEIRKITIFPSKSNLPFLCEKKETKEVSSYEKRLVDFILEPRYTGCVSYTPIVNSVTLSAKEIIIGCDDENGSCANNNEKISVTANATDAENDVLTYNYKVSGGKVVGQGAEVIWDLTGVKPGTYTITVGADDGCGLCCPTKTETVVVKECSDCSPK